jgi:hypothetical protein
MADEMQHGDGQVEATKGHGVEPPDLGYAPPDQGLGESAESEIPTGVDALPTPTRPARVTRTPPATPTRTPPAATSRPRPRVTRPTTPARAPPR